MIELYDQVDYLLYPGEGIIPSPGEVIYASILNFRDGMLKLG